MVTTQSVRRKNNQQEISVLFPHLSIPTSIQCQVQEIMTSESVDGIQYPHLDTLDITTSEYLKLYNKEIVGSPKSKWNDFYQEL